MLEILSLVFGGVLRLAPEVLAWINKRTDNKHELEMMDRQIELQKQKGADDLNLQQQKGFDDRSLQEIEDAGKIALSQMDLLREAIKGQMQITGNAIVDVLNFLVRPLTTYYFLLLYGTYKAACVWAAFKYGADPAVALFDIYDKEDRAMLWSILSFWFVDRAIVKRT